jgi:hypothetical protein
MKLTLTTRDRVNKAHVVSEVEFEWSTSVPRKEGFYVVMYCGEPRIVQHFGGKVMYMGTDEVDPPKRIQSWGPRIVVAPS